MQSVRVAFMLQVNVTSDNVNDISSNLSHALENASGDLSPGAVANASVIISKIANLQNLPIEVGSSLQYRIIDVLFRRVIQAANSTLNAINSYMNINQTILQNQSAASRQ